MNGNGGGITKAQMEEIMTKQLLLMVMFQVIRIEQAPLVISLLNLMPRQIPTVQVRPIFDYQHENDS